MTRIREEEEEWLATASASRHTAVKAALIFFNNRLHEKQPVQPSLETVTGIAVLPNVGHAYKIRSEISQGSGATYLRYSSKFDFSFLRYLCLNATVTESLKLLYICQSYHKSIVAPFFYGRQCRKLQNARRLLTCL